MKDASSKALLKSPLSKSQFFFLLSSAGLFFALDANAVEPLAPKLFFFLLCLAGLLYFAFRKASLGQPLYAPRPPLSIAALALLLVQIFAALFSSSQERSLEPLGLWAGMVLLFFIFYDFFRDGAKAENFFKGMTLLLALECLWGLSQLCGMNLGPLDADARANFGSRISAGFGNPNFFAGFLVLAMPAAFWFAKRHPLGPYLFLLALLELFLSGCKASWLALAFQYFAYGHLRWHGPETRELRLRFLKRWAAAGALVLALAALALPSWRLRLSDAISGKDGSIAFRETTWEGAFKAFEARPWLGFGPASFAEVYPAFRPKLAMDRQIQHSYEVAHAENWILEILVDSGLLGCAALIVFLMLLLWPLWKRAGRGDEMAQMAFLALNGSLVCNLAGLDLFLPSSLLPFLAFAALAAVMIDGDAEHLQKSRRTLLVLGLLLIFASAGVLLGAARWQASRELSLAEELSKERDFSEAIPHYEKCLGRDPDNTEALYFEGASLEDSGHPDQALCYFIRLQDLAPDYVLVHDKKARAYLSLGQNDQAALEWERQLQLDPYWMPGIQSLSGLYASKGKLADAERVLATAQSYFPSDAEIAKNLGLLRQASARH